MMTILINLFSPDLCAMEAKKSAIFSLPLRGSAPLNGG
jgi:hypothetical protein